MEPIKLAIICAERSGSSLLLELLNHTNRLGLVDGFFVGSGKLAAEGFNEYAAKYEKDHQSPEGHLATRITWDYIDGLRPWAAPNVLDNYMDSFTHYLYLSRDHKQGQAVSHYLALYSGKWKSTMAQKEPFPKYSFQIILGLYMDILENNRKSVNYILSKMYPHYTFSYEQLTHDKNYWINALLDWLGLEEMPHNWNPALTLEKQVNPLKAEFIELFKKDYINE